jgi:hypothetical protein
MSLPLPLLGLSLLLSVLLCVHVVRSGREMYWLWIILMFQPIGGVIYLVAILIPAFMRGPTVRKAGQAARETLDPTRNYRDAKAAVDDAPTVHNRMRLAVSAGELGRWDEAEGQYRAAAQGVHAEDPAVAFGLAHALVELGRYGEALPILQKLETESPRTPQTALQIARAYEGLGRMAEAEAPYQHAAARLPGLEGLARQAAFFAHTGRRAQAEEALAEIDKRLDRTNPRFQKEGRHWRDLAADAVAKGR